VDTHALAVLEFARVVEACAGNALSEPGRDRVLALAPRDDRDWINREQSRIAAVRGLRASEGGWGPEPVARLGRALEKLPVSGASWTPAEAQSIATALGSAQRTVQSLSDPRRPAAAIATLAPVTAALAPLPALARAIVRVIDADEAVRDDASPLLKRLRRELRGAEQELVKLIERVIARLDPHQQVPDASVTIRNGRYVMPIRREAQRTVGGIVHDTSATGATLFVEPPAAIEASNHIREVEIDAQREVDRLLLELTDLARPHAEEIAASFDALAELDSLHARARFADDLRCGPVTLGEPPGDLVVRDGRHPLLLVQGVEVVPFDLTLSATERTLLVSGPNTGGKTVLLKAVGLFQLLLQAGFPVPAAAGTVLPCVDNVFADVGDEQSIEASLSTFSAHLRNLRDILVRATAHSLVLIDELGSGTDPSEGAALGAAILEQLTARGVRTLATTHLGALKDLPLTVPGIINASLQFDDARLAPTFRFQQGIPGRSYGLQIAQRLGLPADVIARATARVPEQELAVSALLAELERRETELTQRETTLFADEARSHDHGRRVAERERAVRDREREVERAARAEARRYLLDARADVERTIAALRRAAGSDAERAEQERAARKGLERSAAAHAEALADLDKPDSRIAMDSPVRVPVVGDAVETDSLPGRVGRLLERRDDDAVVAVGSLKLTVPMASVRRASVERADPVVIPLGEVPDVEVKTEIDLRGVRAGDVDSLLLGSLDSAIRADLRSVRVIHGKGTGALREKVTEMLGKDVRVKSFRLGAWNEGGAGVTIVEFA